MGNASLYRRIQRELQMARDANAEPDYIAELEDKLHELETTGD